MLVTTLFTIGFCDKKENEFYDLINSAGVKLLVDIRLWRISRFVPWANGNNFKAVLGENYRYIPDCAPTKELLNEYKNDRITWNEYEQIFTQIIANRKVENLFAQESLDGICFLCSEKSAEKCHRRLVAEYLASKFVNIEIRHL